MKFAKQYDCPAWPGEVNSGEDIVETAGYIPIKKRIENIIAAGERLVQATADSYDYREDIPDEPDINLLSKKGLDITEVEEIGRGLNQRAKKLQEGKKDEPVKSDTDNITDNPVDVGNDRGDDKVLK